MTRKTVARHGDWASPISADSITSKLRALTAPRVSSRTGRAFFRETTEDDRSTIVEITSDGLKQVLPARYSASNKVYEYGASLYDVLPDGRIIFSNEDDGVYLLDPDAQHVDLVTNKAALRYASFSANPSSPWVLAIEEDHTTDRPRKVRNYVVAINLQTAEVKRVASGADFYFAPRFSFDGSRVSWMEWDSPDMMFDAAKLYCGDWSDDGRIRNAKLVAGADKTSVAEPQWGPDGSLFFARESGPHRQLFRLAPGRDAPERIDLPELETAEIGIIGLSEGSRTILPLSKDSLVVSAIHQGTSRLVSIDLNKRQCRRLASEAALSYIGGDAMARLDDSSFLVVGSGTTSHLAVRRFDLGEPDSGEVIRKATDETFPGSLFSEPESVCIRARASPARNIHGFLWMPRNPDFAAPAGELPPLIIVAHGGPTSRMGSGLDLRTQYFTSRGYALLALNYSGSTGYGRDYRRSLFGHWGVVDADDAGECADQLVAAGRVRAGAVGITGISAGGYNTLQVLVRHSASFAAGLCVSGISDLGRFDGKTHKLEMDYTPLLALPGGGADAEAKARIYRERSALYHIDCIRSPLVLLHGRDDTVVPVEQATLVADALRERGADVEIVTVPNEGHMMDKPDSTRLWLEEEEKLWRRTLL
ncbi:hypothetical protein CDD83_3725 [Cordyceps sp. RAO-2017]|nr:hypothetical protein CDD83_3725 [Cordyceps sp. RAO-2017]